MTITILTVGTMGDVRPFVALGLGLKRAGHTVILATGTNFEGFVTSHGLSFAPMRADFLALVQSDEGKELLRGSPIAAFRALRTTMPPLVRQILDDSWAAAQGADCLIFHPKVLGGWDIAAALGIPAFESLYLPMISPTRRFPFPILPVRNLGGGLNRLSYDLYDLMTLPLRGTVDRWRVEALGQPARSRSDPTRESPRPVLYCFSPSVIEPPDDWPASVSTTGFWFLDEPESTPSPDLVAFLESGPPPVYVGFGSMASHDPEEVSRVVVEAIRSSGHRGLLATGWGGVGPVDASDDLFCVDAVPHDWLFPRMAAVVHHGGAGTTAAGLRSGRPTVICPFTADQPYWGRVVADLGVGPRAIPQRRLTSKRLARAIEQATNDDTMRRRAEHLGERIRTEDGVARAVEVIESTVSRSRAG
ncbi:glycosyltransferase [Tautonia marina]|uniref:glycosyltransferase n=1 Tax=Tautonia marina TaxID=2653855 RepID=UPI001260AEFE|nr:glycosyltransferase [Tautonia marina]